MDRNGLWIKLKIPVQLLLIYAWLASLVGTKNFYSVYALCALLSAVALITVGPNQLWGRKKFFGVLLCSILFSLAAILGNVSLFFHDASLHPKMRTWFAFLGGIIVAWNILSYLLWRASNCVTTQMDEVSGKKHPVLIFLLIFCSIVGLDLLYFVTVAYPGVYSADSLATIGQILTGEYNNTMPFWHTMTVGLVVKPVLNLSGNINIAVAVFIVVQIIFLALCMAYAIMTMYQAGLKGIYILGISVLYILMPYNIVYSVTMWKDVLFAAALLLMTASMYRILSGINGKEKYFFFIVGALGSCLWRTNGWYAFAVAALFMLILLRKERGGRKFAVIILVIAIVSWILLNPVLVLLDVESTDLTEALAVPFQQFARYVEEDGWMDEAERELLSMAFDLDKAKELYEPYCVDPVKFQAFRRENLDYIKEHLTDYVKLYIQFFERRPDIYLEAWADVTKGFWCGGFPDPIYDMGIVENTIGLIQTAGNNRLGNTLVSCCDCLRYSALLEPLYAIGLHIWVIIACCLVNALCNRRMCLLSIPFIVISVGLWFGSPVIAEFRYGYPMILAAPFILAVTLCPKKLNKQINT